MLPEAARGVGARWCGRRVGIVVGVRGEHAEGVDNDDEPDDGEAAVVTSSGAEEDESAEARRRICRCFSNRRRSGIETRVLVVLRVERVERFRSSISRPIVTSV